MCLYTLTPSSLWQLQGQWWYAQRWVDRLIGDRLMDWFESDASTFILDFMMALVMHDLHCQLPSFGIENWWFIFYCFCSIVSFRKRPASQLLLPQVTCSQETVSQKKPPADRCCSFFWASSSSPFGELQRLQNPCGDLRVASWRLWQPSLLQYVVDHDAPQKPIDQNTSQQKYPRWKGTFLVRNYQLF